MIRDTRASDARKVVPFGRSSQFYFSRAMHEYERGNLRRVCELLTSAIKYNPEDVWNYYNLALTYEELGEYDKAIAIWKDEVLHRDESFSEAYFHLAVCYAETEDIDLVYKYMEKYLELEPNGDLETAARHIIELLEESRSGEDHEAMTDDSYQVMNELEKKLAIMLNAQAFDEALRICEDTLKAEGESFPLLNRTALICFLAGEEQKGLNYIQRVLSLDANNVGAYCNLVFYYNQKGDDVRVQSIIEQVKDINFASLNEVLRWTQTLGNINKHRRSYEWLRDIYWSGEYNAEMLYQMGVAALHLGKYKETKDYWRQATLLDDMRSPAELYHQLLLQIDNPDSLLAICNYNYDWPLINNIQFDRDNDVIDFSAAEKKILFICIQYYLRYGTLDIVTMVLSYLGVLGKKMQEAIIQELMLSSYDDMKYHVLQEYDPAVTGVSAIRGGDLTYQLQNNFNVKVTMPFMVAGRMVKDNLEAYHSSVLVNIAQKIWYAYCNNSHPNPRRISKSTVWAAAVECIVLGIFKFDCDMENMARRYGIKQASLKRALQHIVETITLS